MAELILWCVSSQTLLHTAKVTSTKSKSDCARFSLKALQPQSCLTPIAALPLFCAVGLVDILSNRLFVLSRRPREPVPDGDTNVRRYFLHSFFLLPCLSNRLLVGDQSRSIRSKIEGDSGGNA